MTAAPPTEIHTARLALRQPREADLDAVYAYASDSEVTRFMDWARLTDKDEVRQYFSRCEDGWRSGSEYTWLLADPRSNVAIGGISTRHRGAAADFGYVVARSHWGRGIATEASSAILACSFASPAIDRLWATCDVENVRSARVLEKVGLAREGLVPGGMVRPNLSKEPRDAYLYAMKRP